MKHKDSAKNNLVTLLILVSCFFIIVMTIFNINKVQNNREIKTLLSAKDISTQIKYAPVGEYKTKDEDTTSNQYILVNDYAKSSDKTVNGKEFTSKIDKENQSNTMESHDNVPKLQYTNEEFNMLSRVIYSESGNQPYSGKIAVGNVVMYRTKDEGLSIEGVINQKGQFDGVNSKLWNVEPDDESKRAALEVLQGKQVLKDAYYYANLKLCSPSWATTKNFICRIGDHWFFKK